MTNLHINESNLILHNADCFDILKTIPDNSINCIISDPPYAIGASDTHRASTGQTWDRFTSEEYIVFLTNWLEEVYRILTPEGTCWMFYGFTRIKEVLTAIGNSKLVNHLENHFVYARSKGRSSKKMLKSLREECAHLTKTKKYIWNSEEYLRRVIAPYREKGGAKRGWTEGANGIPVRYTGLGNVIPIFTSLEEEVASDRRGVVLDIGSGERLPLSGDIYDLQFPVVPSVLNTMEKQVHSTQKAVLILGMIMLISSNEGDTILDTFGGSFSTGVASVICNRHFIGVEKDSEAFNNGLKHLNETPYDKWEQYFSNHLSINTAGFKSKFGKNLVRLNQKNKL
jgi:site-specific DNA-methyltransferase (adenine-specific)